MARGRGPNYVANAARRVAAAKARQRGRGRVTPGKKAGRGKAGLAGGSSAAPFDSQAQRESAELGNEAGDTRASLAAKYASAQNELGFGSGAANPYSRSAENKTDLANNTRGITNTAGNQLYAGSTANKQSATRSEYDKNQKALEDSYAEAQSAYTRGVAQTGRDEALGDAQIKEGAINRAAESEPAPQAVGAGRGRKAVVRGRGRVAGPGADGRNVRRPNQARANNAKARQINARVNARNRGRGRV
jgi:hypothetical protein